MVAAGALDREDDGHWDTDPSAAKTTGHQYATPGPKTIRLEVQDTGSLTASTTRGVIVVSEGLPPAGTLGNPGFEAGWHSIHQAWRPLILAGLLGEARDRLGFAFGWLLLRWPPV